MATKRPINTIHIGQRNFFCEMALNTVSIMAIIAVDTTATFCATNTSPLDNATTT